MRSTEQQRVAVPHPTAPRLLLTAVLAVVTLLALLTASGVTGSAAGLLYGVLEAAAAAATGSASLVRVRRFRRWPRRGAPLAFGTGLLTWSASQVLFVVADVAAAPAVVGTLADWGFVLAALLLVASGGFAVQSVRGGRDGWRGALDGLALALGLTTVCWVAWLGPALRDRAGLGSHLVPSVLIPFLDVVLVTVVVGLVASRRPGRREVAFLVGTLLFTVGDAVYLRQLTSPAGFTTGGVADHLWLLAFGLFGVSALGYSDTTPARDRTSRSLVVLPYLLVLPSNAVGVWHLWVQVDHVVLVLLLAQGAVVVVRQFLALDDHRRLFLVAQRQRAELDRLAHVDSLTGLVNRRRFSERLTAALGAGRPVVAYVDLDRFKEVNDTLGHQAGDELLRAVADRLASSVRAEDCVARWGGDEFAVLVTDPDLTPADVVDRLRAVVARPFHVAGHALPVSASIGAVRDLRGDEHAAGGAAQRVEALLAAADAEMYLVKNASRPLPRPAAPRDVVPAAGGPAG